MTQQELFEVIVDSARANASARMEQAVTTAKDKEQMNNQMLYLTVEATHVLATMIYNDVKHGGKTREAALESIMSDLEMELEMIEADPNDLELYQPGGKVVGPDKVN